MNFLTDLGGKTYDRTLRMCINIRYRGCEGNDIDMVYNEYNGITFRKREIGGGERERKKEIYKYVG